MNTPNVTSKRTASEHPAGGDEVRLYAAFDCDLFSAHHNAAAENGTGPLGNKIPAGPATGDAAVVENLDLDAADSSFYVMMVRSEQNAEQQCEKRELFLLETACSVVQAAVKTALKQLKDELLETSAHLD